MRAFGKVIATVSMAMIAGMAQTAWADSAEASCDLYKHGEHKQQASGPCDFSQRQGYVDVTLRNGKSFSLEPGNQADHFRDQNDNRVVRHASGNSHTYKWDGKKIVVNFGGRDNDDSYQEPSHQSSGQAGDTPRDLRDLVGQSGGEAEDQLMERGYKLSNSSESGDAVYSNWRNRHTGQCVTLRSVDGWYESIVYANDYDCDQ